MRVLMTTDAVGGVWQYSLALVRGLVQDHGCEVLLVSIGDPPEGNIRQDRPSAGVELVTLPLHLEWMRGSEAAVAGSVEEVGRLARVWKPDVIHSNQHCFGLLSDLAPTVVVSHSDVLSWIAWQRCRSNSPLPDTDALRALVQADPFLRRYADLVSTALSSASEVVAPSRFVAASIDRLYGARSTVIHNGLWPGDYHPKRKEPVAVVAGRLWDGAKNAAMAVRAAEGLPVQVVMVGPTHGPSGETAHLPQSENVRYLGPASWTETREILSRASFYLATSSYEPFGLAVLEAALCGCTLIANDIPSYRELWDGTALFCSFNDADQMGAALAAALRDPDGSSRRGAAARDRATRLFAADRMAGEYAGLYRALCAGG